MWCSCRRLGAGPEYGTCRFTRHRRKYRDSPYPGSYFVLETDPGGFISITDIDGTNDNQIAVTLPNVMDSVGNDFLDDAVADLSVVKSASPVTLPPVSSSSTP